MMIAAWPVWRARRIGMFGPKKFSAGSSRPVTCEITTEQKMGDEAQGVNGQGEEAHEKPDASVQLERQGSRQRRRR